MVEVLIIRLHWCRLSERLMRPIVVAEALEFGQLDVQRAHAELAGAGLVELAAAGGVGALHAAAMLGAFGRQHEQFDAEAPAGGRGLVAAVDLHRPDGERRLADQAVKLAPPLGLHATVAERGRCALGGRSCARWRRRLARPHSGKRLRVWRTSSSSAAFHWRSRTTRCGGSVRLLK